tara:strand:- start:2 stop:1012 length:1011 start_codon:yes stop_codon:yes gene_type:complete
MGGLKSAFKSIKRFVKKNTKEIATIAGMFIPGAGAVLGASIGRGIGGLAEGEDLREAALAGAQVYAGASMLKGAGFGFDPKATGLGRFNPLQGTPGVTSEGIGGFFENIGANAFKSINPNSAFAKSSAGTTLPGIGGTFKDLGLLQKAGVGIIGASALDSMTGGLGGDDEPAVMPGPIDQSGYLTSGLTPAQLSDVYGTQGSSTGIAGSMPSLSQSYDYDPVNSTIAELLRQKEEYELAFPEFARVNVKEGGIARLADGGEMPEIDLRESGGETMDSEGSGDEDTIPALLADGEFVVTKQAVKGIGNGDHDAGIAQLYAMMDMNENKAQSMGLGRA